MAYSISEVVKTIRAMVYSMLSAERRWEVVENKKGQIDTIFRNYDPGRLKAAWVIFCRRPRLRQKR